MTDLHRVQSLATALGSALDAAVAERPDITVAEVCGALGAAAGVTVALSMPSTSAEVDELHLDVLAQAYRSALLEMLTTARDARKVGRAGMN